VIGLFGLMLCKHEGNSVVSMYPFLVQMSLLEMIGDLEEGPCADMELRYLMILTFSSFLIHSHIYTPSLLIMPKSTHLKRTTGITSRSTLNRQKTPYPLPDHQQRIPLTPIPNTAGPKETTKRFLALEIETDEEVEEPLEMRPPREATVKLETKTPGRKRRNLVEHSSFPDLVSFTHPPELELTISLLLLLSSKRKRLQNPKLALRDPIEEVQGPTRSSQPVAQPLKKRLQTPTTSSPPPEKRPFSRSPSHPPNPKRPLRLDHHQKRDHPQTRPPLDLSPGSKRSRVHPRLARPRE
jgi:hypothetical protein